MEVHFSAEVHEKLVDSATKQNRDADELVQEVLTQYLADEARFTVTLESWTDEERRAVISHIEEGFLQAERGELIDGDQARREIELMKHDWRQQRSSAR